MSQSIDPDRVLNSRGTQAQLGAFVVAAAFDRAGACAAFALGDGSVHLVDSGGWRKVDAHAGAVLSLAPDTKAGGFLTGGDDGRFLRVSADGSISEIASFGMKWVEHVASFSDGKTSVLACSVGKQLHIYSGTGEKLKTLTHPSSVTGMVFDAKGKRIAASHYNGASLWFVASKSDNPRALEWKGSHTAIAISPDGDAVVTAMQETALHGWRLSDGQHMRMSGYPTKTQSLSFTRSGKWLATSGAESIVLWPFTGGGPMGKAPSELAGGDAAMCTQVACNPQHDVVAAGFSDGLVVIAEIASSKILPVAGTGRGAVSALAWAPDAGKLAFGAESGFAAVVDFIQR
jgi:WD40 repeat protein